MVERMEGELSVAGGVFWQCVGRYLLCDALVTRCELTEELQTAYDRHAHAKIRC